MNRVREEGITAKRQISELDVVSTTRRAVTISELLGLETS